MWQLTTVLIGVVLLAAGALLAGCDQASQSVRAASAAKPPDPKPGVVRVFILAGQSNMGGAGKVEHLFVSQRTAPLGVRLWENGEFRALTYRETFGPEVGFSEALTQSGLKGPTVLCKVAAGGTHLAGDWDPAGTDTFEGKPTRGMFARLRAELRAVTAAIEAEGGQWQFCGMAWMQGERDCRSKAMADTYGKNMAALIARVRADTKTPNLPVIIGRIAPRMVVVDSGPCIRIHRYRETIRVAQVTVADADPLVEWVDTDDLPQFDNLHYDAAGQVALGRRMGNAYLMLLGRKPGIVPSQ